MTTETLNISLNETLQYLPFDSWRQGQVDAVDFIEKDNWLTEEMNRQKTKILEAPTGTGKTGLALGLALKNPHLRFLILTATKLEQVQFLNHIGEIPQAISTVGRNNWHCLEDQPIDTSLIPLYQCEDPDCELEHADTALCTISGPQGCSVYEESGCPYYQQVEAAKDCQIVISNYAYALAILNYTTGGDGSHQLGRPFDVIISDEAHVLDEQLENFVVKELWKRPLQQVFGVEMPYLQSTDQWRNWVLNNSDIIEEVSDKVATFEMRSEEGEKFSFRERAEYKRQKRYVQSVYQIEKLDSEWVVENESSKVVFRPVWVRELSKPVFWEYANRHILMSGTIPSARELGFKVGLKQDDFEFHRIPYTFPVENRLIHIEEDRLVNLSWKVKEENLPILVREVDYLLDDYEIRDKPIKALIHTKSYDVARAIMEGSNYSDLMVSHQSKDRTRVLEEFKDSDPPKVLVSPSMDKAVDLPGEECELIIICKVPYPYLGSEVMKRRVAKSRTYYLHETLMTVIQMAGRGVRSEVDICPTYILDSASPKFMKQVRRMIPPAIKEALRYGSE